MWVGPDQKGGCLALAHMNCKWTPPTPTPLRGQIHPVLLVPRPEPTPDQTRTCPNLVPTLPYPRRRIAVPQRSSAGRGGYFLGGARFHVRDPTFMCDAFMKLIPLACKCLDRHGDVLASLDLDAIFFRQPACLPPPPLASFLSKHHFSLVAASFHTSSGCH